MLWKRRKNRERDLDREVHSDLELEAAELQENGLSAEEAHYAARRAFGNTSLVTEDLRAVWIWTWLEQLSQDLAYAMRSYARTPGFTAIAVITLALGIGATSAIFSIVDSILLHPLPYADSERLVVIWEMLKRDPKSPPVFDSYRDFQMWKTKNTTFEKLAPATWATGQQILTGAGKAREVLAMPVGIDFFTLLGIKPELGRTFQHDDLQRGCTVVLSHRFWMSAFGGQKYSVGRRVTLEQKPCVVIGVMPKEFTFYPDAAPMWMLITPDSEIARDPENAAVGVFGRLKPGVSLDRAQQEIEVLYKNEHRNDKLGVSRVPAIHPLAEQFAFLTGPNLRLSVLILLGAVLFVLIIACVNIANLLLSRSLQRERELAVRAAIGSGRARLLRQLLTESLLLSFAGAALGVSLAAAAIHYFRSVNPIELPPGNPVTMNVYVLVFTVALSIATALGFGTAPAFYASRVDLIHALRASGRSSSTRLTARLLGKGLVAGEVALSLTLLVGAGLLIESVNRLSSVPLGFSTQRVFTVPVSLPKWSYATDAERAAFYRKALAIASTNPGVELVAFATTLPLNSGRWGGNALAVEGLPQVSPTEAPHDVAQVSITPDYFQLMHVPLDRGRLLNNGDRAGAESVAIVNQALARKYFKHDNPIGKRIKVGASEKNNSWLNIVGVAADEKDRNFFREMTWEEVPTVFRPLAQSPSASGSLVVKAAASIAGLGQGVQKQISNLDSSVPVGEIQTMDERLSRVLAYARFRASILGAFAGLALLLAAVGLYGVLSQLTAQRTQEFGVRMALGAQRRDVLALVIKEALTLTAVGLAIGLLCALVLTRFLSSLLYGMQYTDPLTLASVSLLLIVVASIATAIPARRAAKVDPMVALRYE